MNEIAGIGHNNPPLDELLAEETIDLRNRAIDLVGAAERATVTDDDTAARATKLIVMIRDHAKKIEEMREQRKAPFLESGRIVDRHFTSIRSPLIGDDAKRMGGAALRVHNLVDAYRRKQEEIAAAERRRLEEEAEKVRQAAAEAARKQQEVSKPEQRMDAEIDAQRLRDAAAALEKQAAEVVATPIVTDIGAKAHRKTVWKATITDLGAALKHCRKLNENALREVCQSLYDKQVRAGVRSLPGAEITEDSTTTYRA